MASGKSMSKNKRSGQIFFWTMVILPLVQFCIFYVGVNFNSIILAFKSYENHTGVIVQDWVGFENFQTILHDWNTSLLLKTAVKNTFKYLAIDILIIMPATMLFAYYIYKNFALSNLFKVLIFAPSIICIMVLVIFFKGFMEDAVSQVIYKTTGTYIESMFLKRKYAFYPLTIFYIMVGFSGNILIYLNAISNISTSMLEAATIDGASEFKIFIQIVLPSIYKTCVSLLVISVSAIGSNQAYLHSFYGSSNAPEYARTLGYHLFDLVATSGVDGDNPTQYPIASAYGLVITFIVAPVTLTMRWLLNKYGPSED